MASELPVALVSGANRGIGREVARQLVGRGFHVVVGARDEEAAVRAAGELAGEGAATGMQLDVADAESVERLRGRVEGELGRLDVLINNAGIGGDTAPRAADVDLGDAEGVVQTNLFGAWRLTQAFLPMLRASDAPRVVNVSTGMGQLAEMGTGAAAYRTSKAALNALTRVLAGEEREHGVLVNCLNPGWVQTHMGGASAPRTVEEGADTAVWLATLPADGPTGGFFEDREPIAW